MRAYRAVLEAGGNGNYGVIFPELPGCVSAGESRRAAKRNAAEALHLHLLGLQEDGIQMPEPAPIEAPLPAWLTKGIPTWREVERLRIAPIP